MKQRLKKDSNIILDKQKFRSSKKILLMSTMGLAGGLILTGVSPSNIVKADADTVEGNTSTIQDAQVTPVQKPSAEGQQDTDTESEQKLNDASSNNGANTAAKNYEMPQSGAVTTGLNEQKTQGSQAEPKESATPTPEDASVNSDQQQPASAINTDAPEYSLSEDGTVLNISGGTFTNSNFEKQDVAFANPYWTNDQRSKVTKINISGPVIAKGNVSGLFNDFELVTNIEGLDKIDTSQATSLSFAFSRCYELENLDINAWNVSNVQDFSSMFYDDNELTEIDIHDWNLSSGILFDNMFDTLDKLKKVFLPKTHNSDNVTDSSFKGMFHGLNNVESLDLSHLDMTAMSASDLNEDPVLMDNGSLSTLTLSGQNNLFNSKISMDSASTDGKGGYPVAWKATASDDSYVKAGTVLTTQELINLYSTPKKRSGSTTWKWDYEKPVTFKVSYVASDDPTKVFYTLPKEVSQLPYTNYEASSLKDLGVTSEISTDGYVISEPSSVMVTENVDNGVLLIKVPKEQVTLQIEETNKTSNGSIDSITVPVPVGKSVADTEFYQEVSALPNDRKIVVSTDDNFKTGSYMEVIAVNNSLYFPASTDNGTDIQSIVKSTFEKLFKELAIENSPVSYGQSGFTLIFHLVYQPENKPENNNNSNSGSSTSINREIDGIEERVATYAGSPSVQLYDDYGDTIADRKLAPNSDWYTDESMQLNGVKYYRVATGQWTKASDVYLYYPNVSKVRTNTYAQLLTAKGDPVTDRELSPNSNWYTDKYIYINNVKYYRVATNEFVSADQVQEY